MNKLVLYAKTSYEELKKVTWPTREETVKYTLMVLGLSIGVGVFFGIVDYALTFGLEKILLK